MNFYQKFYTNQIHSSSLLCQLATMWKSQVLCDAIIRTGPVITKAHRVVLVAACPMLQSMDNASMGNHLEVRLAADIKQDSINTFLQYLYEGFMMLTEENCRDVEKIARLLQVDSVIKCCADFQKCLNSVTGAPMSMDNQYKYTSYDMLEFRHVRSSNLQKSYHDRHMKRMSDFPRPSSPGSKRQRMAKPSSPLADAHSSSHRVIDDTLSMAHSYRSNAPDPWERIPRPGMSVSSRSGVSGQPGVIDIVEDCLEIIQTEDPEKDTRGNVKPDSRPKQKTVSIGVSSQINTNTDVHIVNVTEPGGSHGTAKPATEGARGSITVNPLSMFNDSASSSRDYGKHSIDPSVDVQMSPISLDTDQQKNETYVPTPPQQPVFPMMTPISQTSKPFAAGSSTQISESSPAKVQITENADPEQKQHEGDRDDSGDKSPSTSADKAPDISIVKIEAADGNTGGLDMYVDMADEGPMRMKTGLDDTMDREEDSDTEHDQSQEWIREEMSNEGSNISGEQNNSWYIGQFKAIPSARSDNAKTAAALKYLGVPKSDEHYLVKTENSSKKLCEFCKQHRNKSRGGWWVYTRYMCQFCRVPLCNGKGCLYSYHKQLVHTICSLPNLSEEAILGAWKELVAKVAVKSRGSAINPIIPQFGMAEPTRPTPVPVRNFMSSQQSASNTDNDCGPLVTLDNIPSDESWKRSDVYSEFQIDKKQFSFM